MVTFRVQVMVMGKVKWMVLSMVMVRFKVKVYALEVKVVSI